MSDEPERLTPAEERVRALLSELADEPAPHGAELTHSVVRTARWQRPARRTLLALATAASAAASGAGATFRAYLRR